MVIHYTWVDCSVKGHSSKLLCVHFVGILEGKDCFLHDTSIIFNHYTYTELWHQQFD